MITADKGDRTPIRESKIRYRSKERHQLARFVSEETVALLFKIEIEDIYRVECWQHIVYVHGKTVSRFVSYADFPPIVEADRPTQKDVDRWKNRWYKTKKTNKAPEFWKQFYTQQFKTASSVTQMRQWGKLVELLKSQFTDTALEQLRENYKYQKECRQTQILA